jgi:aromatic ring-opening dioxygenase catalytic subunit (LigB family)
MLLYKDNLAQPTPPEPWAMEFRQAFQDVVEKNSGPALRRGLTRLMKHPQYRDAHATDDHFMASLFVAGAVGDEDDIGVKAKLMAEDWELTNMCSKYSIDPCVFTTSNWLPDSQYTWGTYVEATA